MKRAERKYSEEQITALKKKLAALEEKDSGKTREEVVKDLEKSFRAAMRKGYSLKEISELCLQEEVFIPAGVLKKHLAQSSGTSTSEKRKKRGESKDLPAQEAVKIEASSDPTPEQEEKKPRTTFNFVKPDTPDDEL